MARRTNDHRQEDLKGMEQPKNAKLENAARRYREAIGVRLIAAEDERNRKANLRELMHLAETAGQIHRVSENGKEYLRYKRANITITIEIKEGIKVKLDDEVADADDGDASAVSDDAEDVEVVEE